MKAGRMTVSSSWSPSVSTMLGPGEPCELLIIEPAVLGRSDRSILGIARQCPGCDSDRLRWMRDSVRGVMGLPAIGEAVTIVLVPTMFGGGSGLLGLKSGWMRSCIIEFRFVPSGVGSLGSNAGAKALVACDEVGLDVGREKFGGLDGGEDGIWRVLLVDGSQPAASAVSDDVACGDPGRKGPSSALAGDSERLPGIVSKPPRLRTVGDELMVYRIS